MLTDINTVVAINPQFLWGALIGGVLTLISLLFLWWKHIGMVWLVVGLGVLLTSVYCLLMVNYGYDGWYIYPVGILLAGVTIYLGNELFIQPFNQPYDFKPDQVVGHVGITKTESNALDEGKLTIVVGTETVTMPYRLGIDNSQDAVKLVKGVQVLIVDYIDDYAYVIPMNEEDLVYLDEQQR